MMARHAYLILAHTEFGILRHLIGALDDERNDIYVHIDARVKEVPSLRTSNCHLELLQDRVKTYWGDTSLMEAEYRLFRAAAAHGGYDYFHLISGVHMPLKNHDAINAFFDTCSGLSILSPMETTRREIEYKFARHHYFVHGQSSVCSVVKRFSNVMWRFALFVQKWLPKLNCDDIVIKASQWCSLSNDAVTCLLDNYEEAARRFRHSFCCDEFFIPYILNAHGVNWIADTNLLFMKFCVYSPKELDESDFEDIMKSDCIFARKLTNKNNLVNMIEKTL